MSSFDLSAMLEAAADPAPPSPPAGDTIVDQLRLKLAVRGWVQPLDLIKSTGSDDDNRQLLGALAGEVETAVESRPGQWYLSVPARAQELARRSEAELKAVLGEHIGRDANDPVFNAIRLATSIAPPNLQTVKTPELLALAQVHGWLGQHWKLAIAPAQIADEIAARTLDENLERMTDVPLVGKAHREALDALINFATSPSEHAVNVTYIYGGGGAGKTTVLAHLQRALRSAANPVPVARIDFDEPSIDPTRMVTLNLALFEQVTRAVPRLSDRMSATLPMLRQTALLQRSAARSGSASKKRSTKTAYRTSVLQGESVVSESASDEGSILYGMLDSATINAPVVIILDTAELVLAQSDRIASSLTAWINFLKVEAKAVDLRLVIAGRDPPPNDDDRGLAAKNLLVRLRQEQAFIAPSISLPELTVSEAEMLLESCKLQDKAVIASAARAVPGNPLLLRITADALKQGDPDLRQTVLDSHRHSRIDPASANNYLMRRVVAHVSDPIARPYVLAAMFSPFLSQPLLEEVVIPAVDRHADKLSVGPGGAKGPRTSADGRSLRAKARRIFRALSSTYWLTRATIDPRIIPFNRDIRAFSLKLLASTDGCASLERDVRQSAEIFHLRRHSRLDKAMATYHAAALGHPFRLPRDAEAMRPLLRDVLDEPSVGKLRSWLEPEVQEQEMASAEAPEPVVDEFSRNMSDADWQLYLEGDASRVGEGMQLLDDDRARDALELYMSRPTRPHGLPPTFVIRAMADLGEWPSRQVDVSAILEEESRGWLSAKSPGPAILSRIYWITRLALFRPSGKLSAQHVKVLRLISASYPGPELTALAGLIAVAEARMDQDIMSPAMRRGVKGAPEEGRVWLAARNVPGSHRLSLPAAFVVVTQRDWMERVSWFRNVVDVSRLYEFQSRLDRLDGQPMAEVNQTFDRERELIDITWNKEEIEAATLLLRGQTTEFLRPLREALLTHLTHIGDLGTRSIFMPVLERMSIRPAELAPENFFERLENNPAAWCTAFVSYADRSRLLPTLCKQLLKLGKHGRGALSYRVAKSFLAWDTALCAGGTSDWPVNRINGEKA